jgi:AcrR family transcriptional regulator
MSPRPAIEHIRKPQILEAAAQVITERGLSGTRIADVAKRAGTSAPAVLYWFRSREELLTEALIADEESFADEVAGVLAGDGSAAEKLRRVIEATVGDSDISLWVELWARSLHDPAAAAARLRLDDAWRRVLAELITAGQVSGEFESAIDPARTAVSLGSLMDGLGVQMTLHDPAVTPEGMLAMVIGHAESLLGVELAPAGSDPAEVVLA